MRHGWIALLFVASSGCAFERADSSVSVPVCPRAETGELVVLETVERPIDGDPARAHSTTAAPVDENPVAELAADAQ